MASVVEVLLRLKDEASAALGKTGDAAEKTDKQMKGAAGSTLLNSAALVQMGTAALHAAESAARMIDAQARVNIELEKAGKISAAAAADSHRWVSAVGEQKAILDKFTDALIGPAASALHDFTIGASVAAVSIVAAITNVGDHLRALGNDPVFAHLKAAVEDITGTKAPAPAPAPRVTTMAAIRAGGSSVVTKDALYGDQTIGGQAPVQSLGDAITDAIAKLAAGWKDLTTEPTLGKPGKPTDYRTLLTAPGSSMNAPGSQVYDATAYNDLRPKLASQTAHVAEAFTEAFAANIALAANSPAVEGAARTLVGAIAGEAKKAATGVSKAATAVSGGMEGILAATGPAGAAVSTALQLGDVLPGLSDQIITALKSLPDILGTVIPEFITTFIPELVAALPQIVIGILQALPKILEAVVIKLPAAIAAALADLLGGVFKGKEGKVLGTSFQAGDASLFGIPIGKQFATGGYVDRTGMAFVHAGERIEHAGRTGSGSAAAIVGGRGGDVHVHAPMWSGDQGMRDLVRQLRLMLGTSGINLALT